MTPANCSLPSAIEALSGDMEKRSLTVFFPMFNEIENLERLIGAVEEQLPDLGFQDYEILIVDDASNDGSEARLRQWENSNPHVRIVRKEVNEGYAVAFRTGLAAAAKEIIFYTDCDLPVDLAEIRTCFGLIDRSDIVVGIRTPRRESLRRALYARVYNLLMGLFFKVKVHDANCPCKLIRRRAVQGIRLRSRSAFVDGELLAEAVRRGLRLCEVPVRFHPRQHGTSSFDSPRAAYATLREMVLHRLRRDRDQED